MPSEPSTPVTQSSSCIEASLFQRILRPSRLASLRRLRPLMLLSPASGNAPETADWRVTLPRFATRAPPGARARITPLRAGLRARRLCRDPPPLLRFVLRRFFPPVRPFLFGIVVSLTPPLNRGGKS